MSAPELVPQGVKDSGRFEKRLENEDRPAKAPKKLEREEYEKVDED